MTDTPRSNDPFEHARNDLPEKSNGIMPNWGALPPDEISQCKRLGVRAAALVAKHAAENPQRRIVTPHPIICAMDFALVHLHRPLKLTALENADDLAFMAEFVKIAQHIDRDRAHWNSAIPLQFYDSNLRRLANWLRMPSPRQR